MNAPIAREVSACQQEPLAQGSSGFYDTLLCQESEERTDHGALSVELLPKRHFGTQLRREMKRTDRSKSPLSLLLLTLHGDHSDLMALLKLVLSQKREIDLVGYLGKNEVAVLLPDTDRDGADRLKEKILGRSDRFGISVETRAYPDQIFESVGAEDPAAGHFYPLKVHPGVRTGYLSGAAKRALDIIGASAGIILASPLMLLVAIAVAISSPGPVIFRQTRIGKGGVPFVFYKFRSMRCDMDDRVHREYVSKLIEGNLGAAVDQGGGDKPLYKLKLDPRVTNVGRFIRKTSLDELPQLFNVLKGQMSLVGPRPPLPYEVEKYQSWHLWRVLEVKPGITGLWQVEGRSRTSFDDMVRLDLQYVRNSSLVLDLEILLKTVKVVFRGDGAG